MVCLIGAGPGDVGLLTLKARELLQAADVVIYDRLADDAILNFCAGAKKIYVGKEAGRHTLNQSQINQLLVTEARQNKIVVRLKGGDPFVFGRGGEEALVLRENNLPFEIVPGVTSAIAVPAYAGIPVTHRGIATSFAVVTGHEDPSKPESTIRWDKLATAVDTLIFLMGVANLPQIVDKLLEHGRKPDTPVALIRWGTKSAQEVFVTTLAAAPNAKILPPAIFIVGEVVNLREQLQWFETRPLFGEKILVTRARAQASKLSSALKNLGAEVVECPTIKIAAPSDNFRQLDAAITTLRGFDRLIFTSANGVEKFFSRLKSHGLDSRILGGVKIAAINSATAEKLLSCGIVAEEMSVAENDVVLDEPSDLDAAITTLRGFNRLIFTSANGVEKFFSRLKVHGLDSRILGNVKIAAINSATAEKLLNVGIVAEVMFVAENDVVLDEPSDLDAAITTLRGFDRLIFTSVNGVEKFFSRLKSQGLDSRILGGVKIAAINSATAEKLLNVGIVAEVMSVAENDVVLDEPSDLDAAITTLRGFDRLIFTSANGVEKFFSRLKSHGLDSRILGGVKIAAIGSATAEKLLSCGIVAEVMSVAENDVVLDEPSDLDAAITTLRGFDRLIFTSANGVEKFFSRLKSHGLDSRILGGVKIAAIGSATAEKLLNVGIVADTVPKDFVAESLADALKDLVGGEKILLARAEVARDVLPDMLKSFGAEVVVVPAYQTLNESPAQINFDALDLITFTSSSTVKNFVAAYGVDALKKIPSAAIGPITAKTLETFDVMPAVVAEKFTIEGLVAAIENFFGTKIP